MTLRHMKQKNNFKVLSIWMWEFCTGGLDSDLKTTWAGGAGEGKTFKLKTMDLLHTSGVCKKWQRIKKYANRINLFISKLTLMTRKWFAHKKGR